MKKLIVITFVALFAISTTMNISATASGSSVSVPVSSSSQGISPTMTREELAAIRTSQTLEYADKFYAETGYTDAQKAEADAALVQIYQSLYLDQNGETDETKLVKQKAVEYYIDKQYTDFSFKDGSVMLMNYASFTDFKKTGKISFDNTYTIDDNGVYTALVQDKDGRIVSMFLLLPVEGDINALGYVGECKDLKAHAVKAYELLKTTDLDLSKTQATLFQMNGFELMYYLTDGASRYFLTFGSVKKEAGDLYYSQWDHPDVANHEASMHVLKYDDMLKLMQNFDTSSMVDWPINRVPTMGGGSIASTATTSQEQVSSATTAVESSETEVSTVAFVSSEVSSVPVSNETTDTDTPAQESSNTVWLWAIVIVAVVALAIVIVMVVRKKKKAY